MPLVFGVHWLHRIPSLRLLSRALSLSIITILADKGSFPRNQAYIKSGKVVGMRLTFIKIKTFPTARPYSQKQGRVTANEQFF